MSGDVWRSTRSAAVTTSARLAPPERSAKYESYFDPIMLTDSAGRISDALAEDVEAGRPRVATAGA